MFVVFRFLSVVGFWGFSCYLSFVVFEFRVWSNFVLGTISVLLDFVVSCVRVDRISFSCIS